MLQITIQQLNMIYLLGYYYWTCLWYSSAAVGAFRRGRAMVAAYPPIISLFLMRDNNFNGHFFYFRIIAEDIIIYMYCNNVWYATRNVGLKQHYVTFS